MSKRRGCHWQILFGVQSAVYISTKPVIQCPACDRSLLEKLAALKPSIVVAGHMAPVSKTAIPGLGMGVAPESGSKVTTGEMK